MCETAHSFQNKFPQTDCSPGRFMNERMLLYDIKINKLGRALFLFLGWADGDTFLSSVIPLQPFYLFIFLTFSISSVVQEVYGEIETLTKRRRDLRWVSCECVCVCVCQRWRVRLICEPCSSSLFLCVEDGAEIETAAFSSA